MLLQNQALDYLAVSKFILSNFDDFYQYVISFDITS